MPILFVQHWDVMPGKFEEYVSFITREYIPGLDSMGVRLVGGYFVKIGEGPRIHAVATVDEADNLRRTISSREFLNISAKLHNYVWKYASKVYIPSGRIQEGPYVIQAGVWKFNHYYNILPGMGDEHLKYVKEECVPVMEELKIPITGGWRLIIGSGPRMLGESTASSIVAIAEAVDTSLYRNLVKTLKNKYVTDYSTRVLCPTGRVEVPYLVNEMMKHF